LRLRMLSAAQVDRLLNLHHDSGMNARRDECGSLPFSPLAFCNFRLL
jgi:hypothetical protein